MSAMTQNILVPTDFSKASQAGVLKAAELARETGAKVTLCHVLDPSPLAPRVGGSEEKPEDAAHRALTELLRTHFEGVAHTKTAVLRSESPADAICRYAQKEDTELIVISTTGRTGLAHLLIGSVAERVVRHGPCPVLTVPSGAGD